MVSKIFFIIGVGGAGKTTLVNNIKNRFSEAHVHDFDEVGVPKNVDEKWRCETINYWLAKAKEYHSKGQTMILCGFLVPSEAEKQPNFSPPISINYGFLHISPQTIKQRLSERGWNEAKIQYHIEWANYLEEEIKNQQEQFTVSGDKNNPAKVAEIFEKWIINQLVKHKLFNSLNP